MRKRNIKIIGVTLALVGMIMSGTNASAADSSVTVTFSSSPTSATLRPDANNERSAKIDLTATVSVTNSGGYSVYVKGNSTALNGKNSINKIPSLSTPATYGDMTANTWGYYAGEGTTMPSTATYSAISTSGSGTKILENTSKKIPSETKTIALSFATKVNSQTAADTYSNTAIISVVSSPMTLSLSEYNNMQDITPDICDASETHETKQLTDVRDGKKYWVTKMLDGNCWMSQNLALDLSTSTALTPSTSDVSSDWTPGYNTGKKPTDNGSSDDGTGSWNLGNYIIKNPTNHEKCENNSAGLSACSGQFMAVGSRTASTDPNFYQKNGATYTATEYDAHYLAGNYYQWNAATAKTGVGIVDANAAGSICPKNWKLPNSGNTSALQSRGSFYFLLQQYGVSSNVSGTGNDGVAYNIAQNPLFFVRGGQVSAGNNIAFAGQYSYYWSSRAFPSGTAYAYILFIIETTVKPADNFSRYSGYSVRCLAPTT